VVTNRKEKRAFNTTYLLIALLLLDEWCVIKSSDTAYKKVGFVLAVVT
jgi:uncharacterized membrane protein YobD (UPF0266 family)